MIFIYPREVLHGDRLRIVDSENNQVFWEEVDSIAIPVSEERKVMIFTKARMIMADAGDKVCVDRRVTPEGK